jgi:indole-3-pyruvate monooxygenase
LVTLGYVNACMQVMPAIDRLTATGARFVNGVEDDFDAVIMATGYASTVCKWLKVYMQVC